MINAYGYAITMEKALESLMYEDDDLIVRLAEQELENEQQ